MRQSQNSPRSSPSHVGIIVRLAFRNLRRQLRRSILTAMAMIVGGWLLIFSFSLGDGVHETWIDSGIRTSGGHVTVEQPEFQLSRKIEDRLSTNIRQRVEQALESPVIKPHVVAVSSRLTVTGLASSSAGSRPARIIAVDPIEEAVFGTIDEQVIDGRYLEPGDELAGYVGRGLIDALDLRLGSRFVVQAQDTEQEIAGQLLRVVGIFETGLSELDQSVIHIPLVTGGAWLGSGRDVTNVGVVLTDSEIVPVVTAYLERDLDTSIATGDAKVMDWQESNPPLSAAIAIDNFGNYLVYGILFIIIAFGIVNTVLMSVLHRRREFGVLQALGLTPGETGAIVLVEGLSLTAISGCLGVGLGLLTTWYFFGDGLDLSSLFPDDMEFSGVVIDPYVYPLFRGTRLAQVFAFILFIGAVASIYPAVRAATINTVEAMKFDR